MQDYLIKKELCLDLIADKLASYKEEASTEAKKREEKSQAQEKEDIENKYREQDERKRQK